MSSWMMSWPLEMVSLRTLILTPGGPKKACRSQTAETFNYNTFGTSLGRDTSLTKSWRQNERSSMTF